MGRVHPRWAAAALAAIASVLAITIAVVLTEEPADPFPTQEAGSRFGAGQAAPPGGEDAEDEDADAEPRRESRADAALRRRPGDAVAGLLVVGFRGLQADAPFFERLRARPYGGVLLSASNYVSADQLRLLTGEVQVVAEQAGHPPVLVAAQQEGGELSAFADLPPRAQADLGAAGPAAVRRDARAAARQLTALGVGLNLAPSADLAVAGGPAQGRGFADTPGAVAAATRASVVGHREAGALAVVRSFPGEGAAAQDPSLGPAPVGVSLEELRAGDMVPFARVARGQGAAAAIQLSNALYQAYDGVTPATLLPDVVEELRGRLRFDGAVVSADLVAATGTTGGGVGEAAVAALRAGCDLLVVPGGPAEQDEAYRAVVAAVREGDVPVARLREATERVASLRRGTRAARRTAPVALP